MNPHKLRIGKIEYTNTWPIAYYFPQFINRDAVEMVSRTPTEINQAFMNHELDIGAISTFAYGQLCEEVVLIPQLSVSAKEQVGSVLLFHKKSLSDMHECQIALPPTSATSVNLLKIIFEKFYACQPQYTYVAKPLEAMMENRDAALLIGDEAILANRLNNKYHVTDLACEWTRWTGKWISFAVWVVRRTIVKQVPATVQRIIQAFHQAKQMARRLPFPMIRDAQHDLGGTYRFWEQYFKHLCYDLGKDQQDGLQLYFQYAYELGLLPRQVHLEFCNTYSFDWVTE